MPKETRTTKKQARQKADKTKEKQNKQFLKVYLCPKENGKQKSGKIKKQTKQKKRKTKQTVFLKVYINQKTKHKKNKIPYKNSGQTKSKQYNYFFG